MMKSSVGTIGLIIFFAGLLSLALHVAGYVSRTDMPLFTVTHTVVGVMALWIQHFLARAMLRKS